MLLHTLILAAFTGNLLELVCDCESLQTTEKFYGGPDCSIEQDMQYIMGSREAQQNQLGIRV